jgi:putative spermidine/putrescine transport system permease protein
MCWGAGDMSKTRSTKPQTATQLPHGGTEPARAWLYISASLIALYLILPVLIIVPMSFSDTTLLSFPPRELSLRWYKMFLGSNRWMEAAKYSLIAASLTAIVATPAGVLAAYAVHTVRGRMADFLWGVVMAPLIVPVVLIGIGLYFTMAPFGFINSLPGLVLAHSMHAVPFVFITMLSAFKSFDMTQPIVAQSLGASPLKSFITITIPQMRFSIIASAFLAFLSSFDEVVIALFVAGGRVPTLPKLMFEELQQSLDPTITAVSSISLAVALVILMINHALSRAR